MIDITKKETKSKVVGIAFTNTDYDDLKRIADGHNVKLSYYLREVIRKIVLKKRGK